MSEENKKKITLLKRKPEAQDWIRIAGILLCVGLAAWITVVFSRKFGEITAGGGSGTFLENLLASAMSLKDYIVTNYPRTGLLILLFLQFMQVIVTAIPSSLTSFASGMIYGLPAGLLISCVGSALGTFITFGLTRLLGRRVLTLFVSEKNIEKMEKLIDGDMSALVLLILFILPSPKDFFPFFVGLTGMKGSKFHLIAIVGRIPGIFVAAYLGANVANRNWALLIGMTAFAVIVSVLFVVFNNKLIAFLKRKKKPGEEAANA